MRSLGDKLLRAMLSANLEKTGSQVDILLLTRCNRPWTAFTC
ncbi:MAG: hypothetical protein RL211_454 [Pseudomonadota bacterium]|jgi:hypothetical protein